VGEVLVRIERRGDRVLVRIENPLIDPGEAGAAGAPARRTGNNMALGNIRERLALFFDAEARLESGAVAGRYHIDIEVPYKTS
jgi:two-component system sensor histidine kinase AlgZ